MWLRSGTNRVFGRTIAALLALIVCGGALDWGHAGGDDPDCDIVIVHHDHNAHHISGTPLPEPSSNDHCYICHSLRLLHNAVTSRYERVAQVQQPLYRVDASALAVLDGRCAGLSSRAPPFVRL